jgi:HK97 family phage major capsid protein
MTDELKTTLEGVQKVVAELRSNHEESLAKYDVLLTEKETRMKEDFVSLRAQMDEVLKSQKRAAIVADMKDGLTEEQRQHGSEFSAFIRKGATGEVLTRATQATLGNDAEGGYVASPTVQLAVERLSKVMSAVRSVARVVTISGPSLEIPIDRLGFASGWVGEVDSRGQTNTGDLGRVKPPMGEIFAKPRATQALLDDASINIESWFAESIAEEFAFQEGAAFINGDGILKPMGFMAGAKAEQTGLTEPAFGTLGFVKSGSATGFAPATATTGDAFTDVVRALKPAYRAGASFAMNRMTEANIAKLKDSQGAPLWRMSLRDGLPSQLVGFGINIMDDMQDIGSGLYPVAFGNFNSAYIIVDRIGIRTLRDPYSAKPYVEFYSTKRVGGGLYKSEALKLIQTAT